MSRFGLANTRCCSWFFLKDTENKLFSRATRQIIHFIKRPWTALYYIISAPLTNFSNYNCSESEQHETWNDSRLMLGLPAPIIASQNRKLTLNFVSIIGNFMVGAVIPSSRVRIGIKRIVGYCMQCCGSEMFIPDSRSRIQFFPYRIQGWQDPGTRIRNKEIFNSETWYQILKILWIFSIPDHGSRGQKHWYAQCKRKENK